MSGVFTTAPEAPAAAPVPAGKTIMLDADPWIGTKLGEFEIRSLLGKGGFGSVYEAQDTLLQRTVAIKVLSAKVAGNPVMLKQFIAEARAAGAVRHPNLVTIYQVGRQGAVTYIVMEVVRGGSCAQWLKKKGPMSETQATWLIAQAAQGLSAAHARGLVHRDIKPANLMLTDEGSVKIADFGLATRTNAAAAGVRTARAGVLEVVGTPNYMSPEQARGDEVDPRGDLYSLGATYYALLTGRPPFKAPDTAGLLLMHLEAPPPDPRRLRPDLPPGCARVIARAMAKDPADRYQNGQEMAADLLGADGFS
jgi:serine/threonine protein kinase